MADLLLQKPYAGQDLIVKPANDDRLVFDFAISDILLKKAGDDLLFTFDDGGKIILTDFYVVYNSDNMPEFIIDENIISSGAFFTVFNVELMPAAGPLLDTISFQGTLDNGSFNEYESSEILEGISDSNEALETNSAMSGLETLFGANSNTSLNNLVAISNALNSDDSNAKNFDLLSETQDELVIGFDTVTHASIETAPMTMLTISSDELIIGTAGGDILYGDAGDDVLIGGLGDDELTGGFGSDTFRWNKDDLGGADTISDFELTHDKIELLGLTEAQLQSVKVQASAASESATIEIFSLDGVTTLQTMQLNFTNTESSSDSNLESEIRNSIISS